MGLYENIKTIVASKGISISKLEKDLNFPRSSIKKYDTNVPSVEKIRMISEYLNVPIDRIIYSNVPTDGHSEWYTDPETARLAQDAFDNQGLKMLLDASKDLSPEDMKILIDMATRMKGTNPYG